MGQGMTIKIPVTYTYKQKMLPYNLYVKSAKNSIYLRSCTWCGMKVVACLKIAECSVFFFFFFFLFFFLSLFVLCVWGGGWWRGRSGVCMNIQWLRYLFHKYWVFYSNRSLSFLTHCTDGPRPTLKKGLFAVLLLPTHQNWPYPQKIFAILRDFVLQNPGQSPTAGTTFLSSKTVFSMIQTMYVAYYL